MKKGSAFLFALLAFAIGWATPVLLLGSMQAVNNTTYNSSPTPAFVNAQTLQQISLTHGVLNSTNDIKVVVQVTADQTNYFSIGTNWPAQLATATEFWPPGTFFTTNLQVRLSVSTTNNQSIGAQYGQ